MEISFRQLKTFFSKVTEILQKYDLSNKVLTNGTTIAKARKYKRCSFETFVRTCSYLSLYVFHCFYSHIPELTTNLMM